MKYSPFGAVVFSLAYYHHQLSCFLISLPRRQLYLWILKKILIDIRNPHYTVPSTITCLCRHLINRNTLSSLTFYNIFETEPSTHSADFCTRADLSEAFSSWSCWILSCTLPPPTSFTFLNFSSNAAFLSSDLQNINLHKQLLQSQSAVVCLKEKKLTLTVLADLSRTQFHLPYRVQL